MECEEGVPVECEEGVPVEWHVQRIVRIGSPCQLHQRCTSRRRPVTHRPVSWHVCMHACMHVCMHAASEVYLSPSSRNAQTRELAGVRTRACMCMRMHA